MKALNLPHRVTFIFFSLFAFAPMSPGAYVDSIGLIPGVNFSIPSATENPAFAGSPGIAFTIGAFTDISIAETWYFSPELRYSGKGAKIQMFNLLPGNIQLDSLDLFFMFKKTFGRFAVIGGPFISVLVKRNLMLLSFVNNDLSNRFNPFDIGLALGIEYCLPVADRIDLIGSLRFQHGIFDMNNDATDTYRTRDLIAVVGAKYIF